MLPSNKNKMTPKPRNQLPVSTLLHFTKKKELEAFVGPDALKALRNEATSAGKKSLTKKGIQEAILADGQATGIFAQSDLAEESYRRYLQAYKHLQDPASKAKGAEVRKLLKEPKKQYLGCIATKISPNDYRYCVDHYDEDPDWAGIEIVPPALKQSVFAKTGHEHLRPKVDKRTGEPKLLSTLPRGLMAYYFKHPDHFVEYLNELRAKVQYLTALKRKFDRIAEDMENGEIEHKRAKADDEEVDEEIEALLNEDQR